jgi:hypothetical protein
MSERKSAQELMSDESIDEIRQAIMNGASYSEIEDMMLCEGLEMDYIEDFI